MTVSALTRSQQQGLNDKVPVKSLSDKVSVTKSRSKSPRCDKVLVHFTHNRKVATAVGAILIVTGLINFCPLFKILGISSFRGA